MRVRSFMRAARLELGLSLDDVWTRTGISKGELSHFERGHSIPRDEQALKLIPVYGDPSGWYPRTVAHVLMPDLGDCANCGDELDPDARRGQRFHNQACRLEHRRRAAAQQASPPPSVAPTAPRRGLTDLRRDLGRAPTAQEWADERR